MNAATFTSIFEKQKKKTIQCGNFLIYKKNTILRVLYTSSNQSDTSHL